MKTPSDNECVRLYDQVIRARHEQTVGFQRLLSLVIVVLVVVTISIKFIWATAFPTSIVQFNLLFALSIFFYLLFDKISMVVRVSEFKRALHDLRIADWREFEFLYIMNRLRTKFMLRNAAFMLLAGWYLYRQQRKKEGRALIAFALKKNPELKTIDFSCHTGLSDNDE